MPATLSTAVGPPRWSSINIILSSNCQMITKPAKGNNQLLLQRIQAALSPPPWRGRKVRTTQGAMLRENGGGFGHTGTARKCHRKQTATPGVVRVKRWGKSPPPRAATDGGRVNLMGCNAMYAGFKGGPSLRLIPAPVGRQRR